MLVCRQGGDNVQVGSGVVRSSQFAVESRPRHFRRYESGDVVRRPFRATRGGIEALSVVEQLGKTDLAQELADAR